MDIYRPDSQPLPDPPYDVLQLLMRWGRGVQKRQGPIMFYLTKRPDLRKFTGQIEYGNVSQRANLILFASKQAATKEQIGSRFSKRRPLIIALVEPKRKMV